MAIVSNIKNKKKTNMLIAFWAIGIISAVGSPLMYFYQIDNRFMAFMAGAVAILSYFCFAFALISTFPKFKEWLEKH